MLNWYSELVIWAFKNDRWIFGLITVLTMIGVGTLFGLLADILLRLTGIDFHKYTDQFK